MAKVPGWPALQSAQDDARSGAMEVIRLTPKDPNYDASTFLVLAQLTDGLEDALQALHDRIERLHQKIDRIEKKIGSV
jgi:hypothetical protein